MPTRPSRVGRKSRPPAAPNVGLLRPATLSATDELKLKALNEALEDVRNPSLCFRCLFPLVGIHSGTEDRLARQQFASAFDRFMEFICCPRTAGEYAALIDHLATCSCARASIKGLTGKRSEHPQDDFRNLIEAMAGSLVIAVGSAFEDSDNIQEVLYSTRDITRGGGPSMWPQSLQSLLPYGVDDTIRGLGQCIARSQSNYAFHLLALMLDALKERAIKPFLSSPTLFHAFALRCTLDQGHITSATTDRERSRLVRSIQFPTLVARCLILYSTPLEQVEMEHRVAAEFGEHDVTSMVLICSSVLHQLELLYKPILSPCADTIRIYECAIDIFSKFAARLLPLHPSFPDKMVHPLILEAWDEMNDNPLSDTEQTHRAIVQMANRNVCWNGNCGTSFVDLGRRTKECASCQAVSYCSKQCQVAAWTHPQVPHKNVCKRLKIARGALVGVLDKITHLQPGTVVWARRLLLDAGLTDNDLHHIANYFCYLIMRVPNALEGSVSIIDGEEGEVEV